MDIDCLVNIMKTYGTNMTKLTGAALDRAVANTMEIRSVHNCEDWVGLTDDEYDEIWRMDLNNKDIMDKTIAKLKEKNT